VQTVRESLGGAWYARLPGWLLVFPAVVILVFGQESALRSASLLLVLASAGLQHVAGGVVFFAVARLSNLRWRVIPLPVVIVGWVASGVARGLTGGSFAAVTIGAQPDFLYRIATWVMVVGATQPLITYLLSQVDHRRVLLGQFSAALENLRVARQDSRETAATTRLRLVAAVRDSIDPVMWEVRASLRSLSTETDPAFLIRIGNQLEVITEDIDRILADPRVAEDIEPVEGAPRAQIMTALEFPPSHYALSASIPPFVVIALLSPEAWRTSGLVGIGEIVVAAVASGMVLALVFVLQGWLRAASEKVRLLALRLGFVFAGLAASTAAFLTVLAMGAPEDSALLYILPIAVAIASAMVMGALGISAANRNLAEALDGIHLDNDRLRNGSLERDRRVTAQVAALLHGPVMSRLSACVMAINFWPETLTRAGERSGSPIAAKVLSHLEAVATDLELLSGG
jgi:hypothetical protein